MIRRRLLRFTLAAAAGAAAVLAYRSDRVMIEKPDGDCARYRQKIAKSLARPGDIALYVTFDEASPFDWISGYPCDVVGTTSVPGRFGRARLFDGTERCGIRVPISWEKLGGAFTLSLWIRADTVAGQRQVILGDSAGHQRHGLRLEKGSLVMALPVTGGDGAARVSFPFKAGGTFSHVAVVADDSAGFLAIYEDGQLKDRTALAGRVRRPGKIEVGRNHDIAPGIFFRGAVDEFTAFRRALSGTEIRDLADAAASVLETQAGGLVRKWRFAERRRDALRFVLKAVDLFNPLIHESRIPREMPHVSIAASNADLRHIARASRQLDRDGNLSQESADRRRVTASAGGRAGAAWLSVCQADPSNGDAREALRLEFEGGGAFRLLPPERCGFLLPLARTETARQAGAATADTRLCTLAINNRFKGVYIVRAGVTPGVVPSRRQPLRGESTAVTREALDEVESRHKRALLNDTASPLSRREVSHALRAIRRGVDGAGAESAAATPSVFALLGSNLSPFFVTGDLRLPASLGGIGDVAWTSSRPEVVDETGRVSRPSGSRPEDVTLTARTQGIDGPGEMRFAFRVMPAEPPLPALLVEVSDPIHSFGRVPCEARLETPDGAAGWLTGDIKLRGKTSLFREKKSYSMRMENPPGWIQGSGSRFVYLMSCYADPSFVRDRFAHELFRSFGSEQAPRHSIRGRHVELFINGSYEGIYVMNERVDRELVGWGDYAQGGQQPVMYRAYEVPAGFGLSRGEGYLQHEPDPEKHGPLMEPLLDLLRFTSGETPDDIFRAGIAERMDLANIMDWQILLNVTDNRDGEHWNYFLCRAADPAGKWFIVSWDYDLTLRGTRLRRSNALFDRLERLDPGYRAALRARWRELRSGLLADSQVYALLDGMEAPVRLVAEWDWRRWPMNHGGPGAWDDMRKALRQRILLMDEWLREPDVSL